MLYSIIIHYKVDYSLILLRNITGYDITIVA